MKWVKRLALAFILVSFSAGSVGQDLPAISEDGKCRVEIFQSRLAMLVLYRSVVESAAMDEVERTRKLEAIRQLMNGAMIQMKGIDPSAKPEAVLVQMFDALKSAEAKILGEEPPKSVPPKVLKIALDGGLCGRV